MDLGVDDARPHRVDADAFGRHFARQPDGERVDRALRRGIVDIVAGAPSIAAAEEMLTMAPPLPPCFVDMRFTASRAQSIEPTTLMRIIRSSRAALISSTRALTSTMPALLTSASSRPKRLSTASNMATMSASLPTSACTAKASPPLGHDLRPPRRSRHAAFVA